MLEYWSHMAAYTDVSLWPALQHRMATSEGMWRSIRRTADEHPDLVTAALDAVVEHGPVTARQVADRLSHAPAGEGNHWGWNWSATKTALEHLFHRGLITSARRTPSFERVYDIPERVLPAEVLNMPALDEPQAHLHLVEHAARALGVATERCLRDYFRMQVAPTLRAIKELAAAGVLEEVQVAGWTDRAWLHVEAPSARPVAARALLSPFDPVVFERNRASGLFRFDYRIEIYVPEHQRVHGYYVLPFLLGDELVARVDLKADRKSSRLLVQSAHAEEDTPNETAEQLSISLRELATWLGLDEIEVLDRGNLAARIIAMPGV